MTRSPRTARREGRGVDRLLADFGHQVPSVAVAEPEPKPAHGSLGIGSLH